MARKTWHIARVARQSFDDTNVAKDAPKQAELGNVNQTYRFFGSVRMTYTICAFLAMIIHSAMRNTISFAILCMVKPNLNDTITASQSIGDLSADTSLCGDISTINGTMSSSNMAARTGDLDWTRAQELAFQGTFYYGYVVTLPFAGRLSDRFGGKMLFVHSITLQALTFMALPLFARLNYAAAVAVQILQGMIGGCGNPALYQLFVVWAHSTERTALLSFAYGGYSAGALLSFPISSYLCRFGWSIVFYVIGSVALVFGICCQWLVYNSLDEHPRLTPAEREYLQSTQIERTKNTNVPWKSILTSPPVYAFTLTHVFHTYGMTLLMLMMPRFLKEAMRFSLSEAGILSSAPFLGCIVSKPLSITSYKYIERNENLNLTKYRKFTYAACNIFTVTCISGIIAANCKQKMLVVLMNVAMGVSLDMGFAGVYWPSLMYFAPSYAGLLSGIANCLANCCGFLAPLIIASVVQHGTKAEWDLIMYTLIVCYLLGASIFGLFSSSKLQKWDQRSNIAMPTAKETAN